MAHAGSEQSGAWPCSWQAGTVTNNTKNPADGVFGFRFLRRPLPMLAGTVPAHHPATAPGMPRKRSNATPWPPQRSASASHRPNPTNKKQEKKRTKKKKKNVPALLSSSGLPRWSSALTASVLPCVIKWTASGASMRSDILELALRLADSRKIKVKKKKASLYPIFHDGLLMS